MHPKMGVRSVKNAKECLTFRKLALLTDDVKGSTADSTVSYA